MRFLVDEDLPRSIATALRSAGHEVRLFVGNVPGSAGAHSQGRALDELHAKLREVIEMPMEDGG